MLKLYRCLECEEIKTNCVEIGADDNYVCLDCLAFVLDICGYDRKKPEYKVNERTETIDPNNVPF